MSSSAPAVDVRGLSKVYRIKHNTRRATSVVEALSRGLRFRRQTTEQFWALKDATFAVAQGEVLGIIGHNGAGKSTMLKIISRITPPTEGHAAVRGRVGTLLEVGTGFHPELSGRENVFLNGAVIGMKRREIMRKYDEIVEFAGVQRFLETPVKRYSSGMYVRLAFAVAAHLEPEILLVDEVLAVGDVEFQRKCLGKMRDVASHGRTVVFVSHNLGAISRLCERALLFEGGRLAADGSPADVIARYMSAALPDQSSGRVEVPEEAPRLGTGEARLRRVRLTTLDDRPLGAVHLDQAVFEVGVATYAGDRVVTANSVDREAPPVPLEAGRREVSVELDPLLLPGEFAIDVGVHRPDGTTVDYVQGAARLTALNAAEHGEDHYPWNAVRGYVRPRAVWSEVRSAVADPLPDRSGG
jgi:lipopolysaccharide transport system ATP-binding protein